jgi:hypothetical protein
MVAPAPKRSSLISVSIRKHAIFPKELDKNGNPCHLPVEKTGPTGAAYILSYRNYSLFI